MDNLKIYKNSHLKRLSGSFKIYANSENKFLHISEKSTINVDLSFWKYIETVKI
jgi:hypothetical protein